jgi:hypothetical protein
VAEHTAGSDAPVCGSCGEPAPYTITLRGMPMAACLRHLNHWRSPDVEHGYGVSSDCLCGRNFTTVRGLREHMTKQRARVLPPSTPEGGRDV